MKVKILFFPFFAPSGNVSSDLLSIIARQVPRQGAVLIGKARNIEAKFAVISGKFAKAPAIPTRLAPPKEVSLVVRKAFDGELVVDGQVNIGSIFFRVFTLQKGSLLVEKRIKWTLPTLQRSLRNFAGQVLETIGLTRSELSPWLSRSPQAYYRFLRAEDLALAARSGASEEIGLRAMAGYIGAIAQDPKYPLSSEGLVRLIPYLPKSEAYSALIQCSKFTLSPESMVWIAKGFEMMGEKSKAYELYEKCFRFDPLHPWAATAIGEEFYESGDEDRALKVWEDASKDPRADVPLLARLATILRKKGRLKEAVDVFFQLKEKSGVTRDVWKAFASLLEETYGVKKAADVFSMVIADIASEEAWIELGFIYIKANYLEKASGVAKKLSMSKDKETRKLASFLFSAARNPDAWARFLEGSGKMERGNYKEALKDFLFVAKKWPNMAEIHYLIGDCQLKLERFEESVVSFKACLMLDSTFPEARSKLGIALVALGRFKQAYEELVHALEETPQSISVLSHLAQACYYLGWKREGEAYLAKAKKIAPDHPVIKRMVQEFYST